MKNILAKFLDFILFITIIIFCICISFKYISSSLMKEIMSQSDAQTKVISLIQSVYPNLDNEKVNKIEERILENKDVENTINSYLNYYTSIASGNYVEDTEVNKAVSDLLNNNFDNVQGEIGLNLNNNQKDKIKNVLSYGNNKLIETIKESAENANNRLSPVEKNLLRVCSIITNKSTLKLLGTAILVLSVLIILLQLKRKKWLENLSVTSIMAGVIVGLVLPLIVKVGGNLALGEIIGKSININVNIFFTEGIILFVIGIVLIVTYKILNRKKKY